MKRLIIDLDDTISFLPEGKSYSDAVANEKIIEKIREYSQNGFDVVINTARNMRTYNGNVGKINANTLPVILRWLENNNIPYDEIYTGKPWCGFEGFYVDDKSVRPSEFAKYSYEEIVELLEKDKLEATR